MIDNSVTGHLWSGVETGQNDVGRTGRAHRGNDDVNERILGHNELREPVSTGRNVSGSPQRLTVRVATSSIALKNET